MTDPTPAEILALPLGPNDSGKDTVRGYLVALVAEVWREEQCFSGKRPFGNSGWKGDFDKAFITAGWVTGNLDEDGWVEIADDDAVDRLVRSAIQGLADGAA